MSTSFSGRVLPWSARFRLAMVLVLAAACLLLFFLGVASPGVRADPDFRPFLWTLLVAGAAFAGLWLVMLMTLGHRVVADERGVRIEGRTAIDLGRPRVVRRGRFDRPARRGVVSHAWIAIEGVDGRVVVIQRAVRLPDWPAARPPVVRDVFDGGAIDLEALRTAARSA